MDWLFVGDALACGCFAGEQILALLNIESMLSGP